jgi:hypothetical protein
VNRDSGTGASTPRWLKRFVKRHGFILVSASSYKGRNETNPGLQTELLETQCCWQRQPRNNRCQSWGLAKPWLWDGASNVL